MKYFLPAVCAFSVFVSGCGSDSDDSSSRDTGIVIDESLRGVDSEPELEKVRVRDGDELSHNSISTVYTSGVSRHTFVYYPPSFEKFIVRTTSDVDDVFHYSWTYDGPGPATPYAEDWVIYDGREHGRVYIEVQSYRSDQQKYNIIVSDLTRGSLGLRKNEYLVKFTVDGESRCVEGFGEEEVEVYDGYSYYNVINFTNGYLRNVFSDDKYYFSFWDGNEFVVNYTSSSGNLDFSNEYKVDPLLGEVLASTSRNSFYPSFEARCEATSSGVGKIMM